MEKTPRSHRPHVTIFGEANSGKSSLFNAILGAQQAIVSPVAGTTTDPVGRAMELISFGPIYLTDTAGINDSSVLGKQRMVKTRRALDGADYAIYTFDIGQDNINEYISMTTEFSKRETPYTIVFTKKDLYGETEIKDFISKNKEFNNAFFVSVDDAPSVDALMVFIADELARIKPDSGALMTTGIVPHGALVIACVTIDGETPKGRLILPQVQFIRECADRDIVCIITTPKTLADAYHKAGQVDLVVVDSQSFKEASDVLPNDVPLVSFSILVAKAKGDIEQLINGIDAINKLSDGATILIAEACAHNTNHEDIGRVKIPAMLKKLTGKQLNFQFSNARDFPHDLSRIDMIIHCGGCMITRKEMMARQNAALELSIPITNYGVLLAYGNGILERCLGCVR